MFVKRNIDARYRGKAKSITCFVCLALVIQHAMRMRHIIVCSLPGSAVFFHVIS